MEQEIKDFNNILINLYVKNLNYLETNHPEIFEKVEDLSNQINNGKYRENFTLEYQEEGYFDIFDIKADDYIYGFNSYEEADKRKDYVNFTQKHSLNLLRHDSVNNNFALMSSLGTALPLVSFLNQKIDFENITFSKIFKFIFIGVGVGVHIHEIYKKIDSMNTLIIEPNLEIFRLSLFTIDYTEFDKENKKLFLSVANTENERSNILDKFNAYHSYMNYSIKHHLFSIEYEYILNEVIEYYSHNFAAAFSYNSVLKVLSRTIKYMNKEYNFLKKSYINNQKPLENKRVLLIGAAPSVDKQMNWIKKNQSKFIIICVDKMIQKLEKYSIVPDIAVSVDPSQIVESFFNTKDKKFLENSSIIFLSQQHKDVIKRVENLNFYFSQVMYISKDLDYSFSVPNVGTFGFATALLLGCKEIYIAGNDSSFDTDSGKVFASDTLDSHHESFLGKENDNSDMISSEDIIEVKGNFTKKVKTTRKLITYRNDYQNFISNNKDMSYKAYNLSEGAYIEGFTPLKIENIDTENFEDKKDDLSTSIKESSTIVKDLDFRNDIVILNSIIRRAEKFKRMKISSKDDFLQKKLDIMIWILEQKKKMDYPVFGNIFLKFTDLIDIYINFTINLKQKKLHNKETLNEIKTYWANTLIELIKDLKKATKEEV
ncbi:MAG: 6-hydroxymethylpterin diphosphokinase MptE-like protein [Campylobacterota bacterium]